MILLCNTTTWLTPAGGGGGVFIKIYTPTLHNVILRNVVPSLISSNETLGNKCAQSKSPSLLSHFPSHISWVLALKWSTKVFRPHARTHHVVIVVIIIIIAMLTLCYSTTSHATPILYCHTPMLTLQTPLLSRAIRLP